MKRLRHPIRAIREPFGTAGVVIGVIALIAALGGTALAAGALTGKQKKEVEKIAKKFAGKPGAQGLQGPKGDPGPKGDTGLTGAEGKEGKKGDKGDPWAAGGVLPLGATETGVWGYTLPAEAEDVVALSFTIPLAAAIPIPNVHIIKTPEEDLTDCPGTADQPAATPGQLCLYALFPPGGTFGSITFSKVSGVLLSAQAAEEPAFGVGTWAVTAPTT